MYQERINYLKALPNNEWRKELVKVARGYLGTPFKHQGRLKDIGIDCVGLLVEIGKEMLAPIRDYTKYGREPNKIELKRELIRSTVEIDPEQAEEADILIFWIHKPDWPQHAGILTDYNGVPGILHTYANVNMVIEHELTRSWRKRIDSAYQFRRAS